MSFHIIPAIDLLDGRCVRLLHGDFDKVQYYDVDTLELAASYRRQGAQWLHVVDLAASRDGKDADTGSLMTLLGKAPQKVQTGGGVRKLEDVMRRLEAGADRVVVGSICVKQPDLFSSWLQDLGAGRLVAALDVRLDEDGRPWPRSHGWTRGSHFDLWQLLDVYQERGLRHLLCTDIGRDGAMSGPNVDLYSEICQRYPALKVQASGGVSNLADLEKLSTCGADSAISGKALLDGRFSVQQAVDRLS